MRWVGYGVFLFAVGVFAADHLFADPPFSRRGVPVFCDHLAYYTAGRLVRDGRAGELYDHAAVGAYQAGLFPPGRWDKLEAFRNPPFAALPFAVTGRLPFVASGWLWALLGVAAYLGGLLIVGRAVPDGPLPTVRHSPTYGPPLFAVATVPAALCVLYGQTSLLAAGVLAVVGRLVGGGRDLTPRPPLRSGEGVCQGACSGCGREVAESATTLTHPLSASERGTGGEVTPPTHSGRLFLAGLVAGLLWAKPPLLLGLVVWGLLDLRRMWPAAVGCAVTGAVLVAGSYAVIPEAWAGFVGTLRANAEFDDFDWWKAPGPRSFGRLLLGPGPAATAVWLLAIAAGLWGFVRVWRANRDRPAVTFAAAVLLTLWASPHAMIYDWALVAVPAVVLHRHVPGGWRWSYAVAWAALAVGTEAGMLQSRAWGEPVVQVATPALGWAGWRTVRRLTAP